MSTSIKVNQHRPIAPAATNYNNTNGLLLMQSSTNQSSGYKKKYTFSSLPYGEQPASVLRRNARERNRVKQVNNGFSTLRQHIPQTVISALTSGGRGASKKLSKVDTLRLAVEYIRRLKNLIEETDSLDDSSSISSQSSYASRPVASPTGSTGSYYSEPSENQFNMQYQDPSSPTPSVYSADGSHPTAQFNQPHLKYEPFDQYEHYNNYYPEPQYSQQTSSEDEELLDYISTWQEQ